MAAPHAEFNTREVPARQARNHHCRMVGPTEGDVRRASDNGVFPIFDEYIQPASGTETVDTIGCVASDIQIAHAVECQPIWHRFRQFDYRLGCSRAAIGCDRQPDYAGLWGGTGNVERIFFWCKRHTVGEVRHHRVP